MSLVKTAVDAVVAALSGVAPQVSRVRLRPLPAGSAKAVLVRPVQAEVLDAELTTGRPYSWNVLVAVECYARAAAGSPLDVEVDGLVSDVYSRLMTDASLGGAVVQVQPQGITYDFDVDGEQTVCASISFLIRQRSVGSIL